MTLEQFLANCDEEDRGLVRSYIQAAVLEEREACAKIADEQVDANGNDECGDDWTCRQIAQDIRKRGQK